MTALAALADGNILHFFCPGCNYVHGVVYGKTEAWAWNGSLISPTITPSVLVKSHQADPDRTAHICHSFVTHGRIQFLADSTHELSGQTIDLPPWPYGQDERRNHE